MLIFGIGTRNSSTEVQRIVSDPRYAQSVAEFSALPNVEQQFSSTLNSVLVGVTPIIPTVTGKNAMFYTQP